MKAVSFLSRRVVHPSTRSFASSTNVWRVDNPYTGSIYTEVPIINQSIANQHIATSVKAQKEWKHTKLEDRMKIANKFLDAFQSNANQIALDVSSQMGKPLSQAMGEVSTMIARGKALIELAPKALADEVLPAPQGFQKRIAHEPIGVVLLLAPWNYPLLCGINTIMTAILSGCSVLVKHSDRTPLCADHFEQAFEKAGVPKGLVKAFHADHDLVARVLSHPDISYVSFTGSVAGGRAVYAETAKHRFIDVGLELGGKDPAYVAADADLDFAIPNVIEGNTWNAGQSCCAVERVYVARPLYNKFVEGAVAEINKLSLGNPLEKTTSMGPLAQAKQIEFLKRQVDEARSKGATILTGGKPTTDASGKGRFFAPTIITNANHSMSILRDESFGPVIPIVPVDSDEEAVKLMNDSPFGLTASVWTSNLDRANRLAAQLETGTVFMNRCDNLDPYLSWSGRKDSGKGIGLSHLSFAGFTRTKSYNFRLSTK